MLKPGEYADILRAIGWTLDQRLAGDPTERVEIVVRGTNIVVGWTPVGGRPEKERYPATEIDTLRERAHALRAGKAPGPAGAEAESLRTIGQYLDEHHILLERLVRLPTGHRITGVLDWHTLGQWYQPELVEEMSEDRRRHRGAGTGHLPPAPASTV